MTEEKIDIDMLTRRGVRCHHCENWQAGLCWLEDKPVERESDCMICDDFNPDSMAEFPFC